MLLGLPDFGTYPSSYIKRIHFGNYICTDPRVKGCGGPIFKVLCLTTSSFVKMIKYGRRNAAGARVSCGLGNLPVRK
jgi:hypothetical protein